MDRQDIDALLIGALYSELTPADEARLATHLESHPADRGALADLKVAREAVAASRIFTVQLDPPQAVSALLLQEAHRRAPRRVVAPDANEGWFARFARNFMAHPAMAAAAMLVLVMGGAGILWMKNGDSQFADKQADQTAVTSGQGAESMSVTAPAPAAGSAALGEGSAFGAALYEEGQGQAKAELAIGGATADGKADESRQRRDEAQNAKGGEKKAMPRAVQVTTEDRAPKDLDDKNDGDMAADKPVAKKKAVSSASAAPGAAQGTTKSGALDFGGDTSANAVSGAGPARGGTAGGGYAQPPPPPTATKTAQKPSDTRTATVAAPTAPKADAAPAPAKEAKTDVGWAKGEHARAVALAKSGDCAAAAKVALSVSIRASSYYAQYMATDRQLKQCAQYINAERERDASQKVRAQKRVNADESAPAQTK